MNYQTLTKKAGEAVNFSVQFDDRLVTDEDLTGTPTVEELWTSDLTIDNVALSTDELLFRGIDVAAGRAVTFRVAGGTARSDYTLRLTAGSNLASAQTLVKLIRLKVT